MHFAIYLPTGFYASMAATIVETLQAVNEQTHVDNITFEFVSGKMSAVSRSGILFASNRKPTKKMDVLILLTGLRKVIYPISKLMEKEIDETGSLLRKAQEQRAVIAATCGAAFHLASFGLLDGRRATISWWLKKEISTLFPKVKWETAKILVRDGHIYTCGGGFSGLELITTLLADLGFSEEERIVRKLLVFPPARQFQSPYEFPLEIPNNNFESRLNGFLKREIDQLNLQTMADYLGITPRTLSRKFQDELAMSPGKWIQQKKIDMAITLLGETKLSISEICYKIGYQDASSFTRLFSKITGMSPGEFRRQTKS